MAAKRTPTHITSGSVNLTRPLRSQKADPACDAHEVVLSDQAMCCSQTKPCSKRPSCHTQDGTVRTW
jgi:hypothetical protein